MTEYDRVYFNVFGTYIVAYMMVCEWKLGVEPIAEEIEEKTIALLREYGEAPLCMILKRFKDISRRVTAGESINPMEEFTAIRRMARGNEGERRFALIAAEVYKSFITRATNGSVQALQIDALVRSFTCEILGAQFFERHPLGVHYNDISQSEYEARLRKVRHTLEPYIEYMVAQIVKSESFQTLHKMPKRRANAPDFGHLDISMLGESQDEK